jgi:integrase/recombinase XerD
LFDRNGSRKYLNEIERKAYLEAITGEPEASRRAFLLTLFYTGCRISEGLGIKVERIDFTAKAIIFETLKRRKKGHFRMIPVPDSLIKLLQEVIANKGFDKKVFPFSRTTAWRMVKAKMRDSSVVGAMACPKGLRHGHAVACVAVGVPLSTIQKWLGHARMETTAIYLAVSEGEERKLANKLWVNS